jgi:(R,R)-butanediol dehydrogenase / meso-butanediol dehydrogenase / diacetyl reductase
MMRAAVFQGIGRPLLVEARPEPELSPGDLLIGVSACGICGSDLHASEVPDYGLQPGTVLGHEFAGQVLESAAPGFAAGDRVAAIPFALCAECEPTGECHDGLVPVCPRMRGLGFSPAAPGGYAERVKIRASQALRLPEVLSLEDGALLEPLAVGAHAVALACLPRGARVLVLGAGPIGLAVAAFARTEAGAAHVVVAEPAEGRRARALAVGATAVTGATAVDELRAAFAAASGGPPDAIFECVGVPGLLQRCIEVAPPHGRIVVVGVCMEEDRLRPRMAIRKEIALQFAFAYARADFDTAMRHLAAGTVRARDFVTSLIGLDALPDAFEALRRPSAEVKVLVDPGRKGA